MSKILDEVLAANTAYAAQFGERASLTAPPTRHFAILTCMDARIDPAKLAGLSEGDAHVIRNAGGRASDDAIRSLVISYKLLGTTEWFVIHHTDCGMQAFTSDTMINLLRESLAPAERQPDGFQNTSNGPGSTEGQHIAWLTIHDLNQSVIEDVARIRKHPLVPAWITLHGYIYDVKTGRLLVVPEACAIGKPPETPQTGDAG
ncbi:MAG: carbonic anhydrase [Anaerolineae bacterium]|jgi:carbonic anhydrase|nr:carbonic anhydrase [Anaerolineae bacterium]